MNYMSAQILLNGRIYITCDIDTISIIWGKITGKGFPREHRKKYRKAYIGFLHISRGFNGGHLELFHNGIKIESLQLTHKL